jgi:hypothetical protein
MQRISRGIVRPFGATKKIVLGLSELNKTRKSSNNNLKTPSFTISLTPDQKSELEQWMRAIYSTLSKYQKKEAETMFREEYNKITDKKSFYERILSLIKKMFAEFNKKSSSSSSRGGSRKMKGGMKTLMIVICFCVVCALIQSFSEGTPVYLGRLFSLTLPQKAIQTSYQPHHLSISGILAQLHKDDERDVSQTQALYTPTKPVKYPELYNSLLGRFMSVFDLDNAFTIKEFTNEIKVLDPTADIPKINFLISYFTKNPSVLQILNSGMHTNNFGNDKMNIAVIEDKSSNIIPETTIITISKEDVKNLLELHELFEKISENIGDKALQKMLELEQIAAAIKTNEITEKVEHNWNNTIFWFLSFVASLSAIYYKITQFRQINKQEKIKGMQHGIETVASVNENKKPFYNSPKPDLTGPKPYQNTSRTGPDAAATKAGVNPVVNRSASRGRRVGL